MLSQLPTKRNAFTLIELLVVITIMAVLTAVSAAAFNSYSRTQNLSQSAKTLETALKEAQNRVLSSVEGINWGVHVVPGTNTLELFSTPSNAYTDPAAATFPRPIVSNIEFFDPLGQLPAGYNVNALFVLPHGAVGFLSDDGARCIGGSGDFDCSPDLGINCVIIGVRLQGTAQARYLKVNERNIFEDDDATSCP